MDNKNLGVIIEQPKDTDFFAGDGSTIFKEVCNDWSPYTPSTERQYSKYVDSMDCVARSATHTIETVLNFWYANGMNSVSKKFFEQNGYVINGTFHLSSRFTAKVSGTTREGNRVTTVWDAIRHCGIVPEKTWAQPQDFTWDEYYAPINQSAIDMGLESLKHIVIQYEWVIAGNNNVQDQREAMANAIKQSPVQAISLFASGAFPIKARGCGTQHATMNYGVSTVYKNFDTYDPFYKDIALDYCFPWVSKPIVLVATEEVEEEQAKRRPSQKAITEGLRAVDESAIPPFSQEWGGRDRVNWAILHRRNIFWLYINLLYRVPNASEVNRWLQRSPNIEDIKRGFMESTEYKIKHS